MNSIQRSIFCVTLAGVAWSQTSTPSFEVATIKPSAPTDDVGQMIRDPRLVAIAHATPQNLIAQAFRIKDFQISGPGWLDSEHFDIMARLPDGATQDQFPAMLQALLKDRFALVFHKEQRTMSSYVLLPAKGPEKLKAIKAEIGNIHTSRGAMRLRLSGNVTMPYFAGLLSNMVNRPVVDMTDRCRPICDRPHGSSAGAELTNPGVMSRHCLPLLRNVEDMLNSMEIHVRQAKPTRA